MPPDRRPALRINSIWDVYFSPARKADESSDSLLCLSALVLMLPPPPLVPLLAASDTPLVMREKGGRDDGVVDVDVGLGVVGAGPGVVATIVLPPPLLCRKLPPPPPLRSN